MRAILAGDLEAMGETAALGYVFAQAVLDRRMQEMIKTWGKPRGAKKRTPNRNH